MRAWVVKGNKNTRTRFADDEWKLSIDYTKKTIPPEPVLVEGRRQWWSKGKLYEF